MIINNKVNLLQNMKNVSNCLAFLVVCVDGGFFGLSEYAVLLYFPRVILRMLCLNYPCTTIPRRNTSCFSVSTQHTTHWALSWCFCLWEQLNAYQVLNVGRMMYEPNVHSNEQCFIIKWIKYIQYRINHTNIIILFHYIEFLSLFFQNFPQK